MVRGLPTSRGSRRGLPGGRRAVTATCGGLRVTSVYVPNGRTPDDPHYLYKLDWLAALRASVNDPATAIVAGDMNIASTTTSVGPALFVSSTHVTPAERKALDELVGLGLRDVVRDAGRTRGCRLLGLPRRSLPQDLGMRIDLVLGAPTRSGARRRCGSTGRPARARGPATTRR